MLDERARSELLATFQQELEEHCRTLARAFLVLEKEPEEAERRRALDEAFRAAHSLKGAARAVTVEHVERLAHGVEDVLDAARRGDLELTPALFDRLYAVVDALADTGAGTDGANGAGGASAVGSDALLRDLASARESAAGASRPAPGEATPLPTATLAPSRMAATALAAPATLQQRPDSAAGETVRLPAARLDAVLEQLGELIVPQLEGGDALAAMAVLRRELEDWQREWRRARPSVRRLEREAGSLGPLGRFLEVNETHLASLSDQLLALSARLAGSNGQLGRLTHQLQAEVKRLRMLPFDTVAGVLERAARDLARLLGKEARLLVVGADTELDRRLLEEIKDPLVQLLRNAMDHGIEPATERRRLGKPATGSIVVAVSQRGGAVTVEVEDDGAGLDPRVLRRAAAAHGLLSDAELAEIPDDQAWRLIFLPGFTSREETGPVSGRGVGLDVVARNVERLGGRIDVHSTPGQGARFVLTLPLTLATMRALLVEAGGTLYALPASAVERVVRPERLGSVGGRPALVHEGSAIPVAALAALLGGTPALPARAAVTPLVLLATGTQRVALEIERVVGEQEIVVKPLGYPLVRVRGLSGATILGSGEVVPILNAADMVRAATRSTSARLPAGPDQPAPRRARILVADDSLTTRTLERYILEAAGYDVDVAGDGAEAFSLLQERQYDALVSDVDMPRLDGISLAARLRQEPTLRALPVILVTSLESAEDRERGLHAGADAYIVKSAFDQDHLLRTVRELV